MRLSFGDHDGATGEVTETLDVEDSGNWKEDVEECVRTVESDLSPGRDTGPAGAPYTRLVLELPEEALIVEIEQTD